MNYKARSFFYNENMISHSSPRYEDINDVISATKFGTFNRPTNVKLFLCNRSIFEDCSKIFGNLRQFSDIFLNVREMVGNCRMRFGQSSENIQKFSENAWKSLVNC